MKIKKPQTQKISFNVTLFILLTLLFTGCATMSKQECQQADWYLKGVDDAVQGYPLDRVVDHGKACARVQVVPDMKAYREGHMKGARLYCVPGKGYTEGRRGAAYNGICPVELEPAFLRAYRDGQDLYQIQKRIDNLQSQVDSNNSQINNNLDEIDQLKRDIVNSDSEKDRRHSMRRIDELDNDNRRLDDESRRAVQEQDEYQRDYRNLEEKHYRMGYLK